jgi:pimeloyl-ACP methyl ester carboxylesterase
VTNLVIAADTTHRHALRDGRTLAYIELGDPNGRPVVFLHGLGSSMYGVHPDESIAERLGVRLIAPDRPGIGPSDPEPRRTLADWADDLASLLDELGLDRVSLVGWSAGGPHALAFAATQPDRVERVVLVSSAAPLHDPGTMAHLDNRWRAVGLMARHAPSLMRPTFNGTAQSFRRDPEGVIDHSIQAMVAVDQAVAGRPEIREQLMLAAQDAFRQGGEGIYEDAVAVARPWGFELSDVAVPVRLWHGCEDTTWSPSVAEALERQLRQVTSTFVPGAGHLLYLERWADILASAVGQPFSLS